MKFEVGKVYVKRWPASDLEPDVFLVLHVRSDVPEHVPTEWVALVLQSIYGTPGSMFRLTENMFDNARCL